jgi:protein-tyrosine phosphatase
VDRQSPPASHLLDLAQWVLARTDGGQAVLIHCHAGRGRSVTVGLATLMAMGFGLGEAYRIAQKALGLVEVTDDQQKVLVELEQMLSTWANHLQPFGNNATF